MPVIILEKRYVALEENERLHRLIGTEEVGSTVFLFTPFVSLHDSIYSWWKQEFFFIIVLKSLLWYI